MADNTTQTGSATVATEDVGGVHYQKFIRSMEPQATYRGRAQTFRQLGIAGAVGQRLAALFNPTGSGKIVNVNQVTVDLLTTVIKAATVIPPLVRIHKITTLPTGGTAIPKVSKDSALPLAAASIAVALQGTASDGGAATAIASTPAAGSVLTQEFAPRMITAAGYEMFDRTELLEDAGVVLRAGEGILVNLDYTAAGQNPITDHWIVGLDWFEE
jgi:hypothetical protein